MPRVILLTDFAEEYAKRLLNGIVEYSNKHESWVLCKMPLSYRDVNGIEGVLEWAKKWGADGIIAQFHNSDNVAIFKENGIAAIAQDFKDRFSEIPNISGDHTLTGRMGARYFIKKGFTNFGFYGFRNIVWSKERCYGFREELGKYGLSDNFYEYQNADENDLWFYEDEALFEWLQSLPKPIALMICDDRQGQHIIEACRQCSIKIPEEVSVLGVDNDESICNLSYPALSSIDQAVERGGYETAQLLEEMIHNPDGEFSDVIVRPTQIVTRESSDIYSTKDKYISITLKYIHQNLNAKIKIDDLVSLVPLSRRLLERRFKDVTKFPIYTYIFNLRIEQFVQKLLETEAPICDIVLESGFSDYKNISRQFKSLKGCTPSEYRVRHHLKNKSY